MARRASFVAVLLAWGAGCDMFPETPPTSQLGDGDSSAGGSGGTTNSAGSAGHTGGASGGAGGAGGEGGTNAGGAGAGGAGAGGEAGSATVELDIFVSTAGDDVNEDGGSFDASSTKVWVGTGENPEASYAGFRFDSVEIPKGATVLEARLELFDPDGQWTSLDLEIAAEASSSCKAFKSNKAPSGRPLTTATVSHVSNEPWTAGEYNLVDDVSGPVQEVVSMSGWSKGDPLCVIVKGRGAPFGRKFGSSFEGGEAPRLRVRYGM